MDGGVEEEEEEEEVHGAEGNAGVVGFCEDGFEGDHDCRCGGRSRGNGEVRWKEERVWELN